MAHLFVLYEKKAGLACTHFGYLDIFPLLLQSHRLGLGLGYIISKAQGLALSYPEQWLICGSVALSLGAQGVLHLSFAYSYLYTGSTRDYRASIRWATYRIISAGMILLIPILRIPLSPILLVCILAAICIAQIVIDLKQHPYHRRRRVLN